MKQLDNYRLWRLVLIAMLVPLALIAFWPSPVDQPVQDQLAAVQEFLRRRGIPIWVNYKLMEASANVALFVPLGVVGSLAFPTRPWWQIGAFGLMTSCCAELGQLLFLHNRFASFIDLATNASGAVTGSLVVALLVRTLEARHQPAADL